MIFARDDADAIGDVSPVGGDNRKGIGEILLRGLGAILEQDALGRDALRSQPRLHGFRLRAALVRALSAGDNGLGFGIGVQIIERGDKTVMHGPAGLGAADLRAEDDDVIRLRVRIGARVAEDGHLQHDERSKRKRGKHAEHPAQPLRHAREQKHQHADRGDAGADIPRHGKERHDDPSEDQNGGENQRNTVLHSAIASHSA